MFRQETKDAINGWGSMFRFITPILVTLALFIVNGIKDEVKEIKQNAKELTVSTLVYNTNHLTHHASIEREICERLASIEAKIR